MDKVDLFFAETAALCDEWRLGTANRAEIESKISDVTQQWLIKNGYTIDPAIKFVTVQSTCNAPTDATPDTPVKASQSEVCDALSEYYTLRGKEYELQARVARTVKEVERLRLLRVELHEKLAKLHRFLTAHSQPTGDPGEPWRPVNPWSDEESDGS